jgi:hypothetical protein
MAKALPVISPAKVRRCCGGWSVKPPPARGGRPAPDYEYYQATKARLGTSRARVSVARKILRRSYHLLANLGEVAIEPV